MNETMNPHLNWLNSEEFENSKPYGLPMNAPLELCDANGIWHNYALTDVQLMNVAAEMSKKNNRVVVNSTNSRPGLYRFTCKELLKYEF